MPAPSSITDDCVDTIRLKIIKFTNRISISNEALNQCKFRVWEDAIRDNLVIDFTRKIPTLAGEQVWVPASWWEHFKLHFFKGWLLRKYPVSYEVYEARLYLPNVPLPETPPFELRIASFPKLSQEWFTKNEEGML